MNLLVTSVTASFRAFYQTYGEDEREVEVPNATTLDLPPRLRNEDFFESLIRACQRSEAIPVAVCWPCSDISLMGALEASAKGLIRPMLVGREQEIRSIAQMHGLDLGSCSILDGLRGVGGNQMC